MTTLRTHRRENVSLADALQKFPDGIALVYAPRWCGFAQLVSGALKNAKGDSVPADVFEVRAFHQHAELRWLKNPTSADGSGNAVILGGETPTGWTTTTRDVTETLNTSYLLWGKGSSGSKQNGWGKVAEARIGGLDVPLDGISDGTRVLLHAIEYVAEDDCGSAFVFEERLTHLTCGEK